MERYFDNIFEKLYTEDESKLWYQARDFVLNHKFFNVERGFANVEFDKVTDKTLAVARQIALVAHYTNYNEKTGENRSIISFYGSKSYGITSAQDVKKKMKDYFGHLFEYCLFSFNGDNPENRKFQDCRNNNWLPLDIEFRFYKDELQVNKEELNAREENIISASDIESFFSKWQKNPIGIDITKGMLVNMVYNTGVTIDNLPACNNDNVARYDTALKVYCYKLKTEHIKDIWDKTAKKNDKGQYNEVDIKNQLSSIFCADCFETRLKNIPDSSMDFSKKSLQEYLMYDFEALMKEVNKNINALAICEHNRWNVEKLIMGFSPLESKDRFDLECIFGKERTDKIKNFKKEKKHIDLGSNNDLRRVNPADVKYDYFLMLAMPQILQTYYKK